MPSDFIFKNKFHFNFVDADICCVQRLGQNFKTTDMVKFSFDSNAVKNKIYPLPQQWNRNWKAGQNSPLSRLRKLIINNARYINEWIKNSASQIQPVPTSPNGEGVSQWLEYILHGKSMCEFLTMLADCQGQTQFQGIDQFLLDLKRNDLYPYLVKPEFDPQSLTRDTWINCPPEQQETPPRSPECQTDFAHWPSPQPSSPHQSVPALSPETWFDILLPLVNPECPVSPSDEERIHLLKNLLKDSAVASIIRTKLPWVLTEKTNLYDLLENRSPYWARFVALLFEFAERELGRFSRVFPTSNLQASQAEAIATVLDKVDVVEILVYDPSTSIEDCLAIWRANAENYIQENQLVKWSGQNLSFWSERALEQEMVERLYQKIMTESRCPTNDAQITIRQELLETAKAFPKCIFDKLQKFELPNQRPARQNKITLADRPNTQWSASQFLKELDIQNSVLEKNLQLLEKKPTSFHGMSADKVSDYVIGFGATFMQAILVINALKEQKFIQ